MKVTMRTASQEDFPEILAMIKELAALEQAEHSVTNTLEQMQAESDYFTCVLAVNESNAIVGMALYFFAYYTWVGKSLYLDDLVVKEEFRGSGVGTQLLDEIFRIAKHEQCKRIRWQVLDWNQGAINLYKKRGATVDGEWLNCDIDQAAIAEFKSE